VARELLGCWLLRRLAGQLVGGIIVETEAYLGEEDPGSHAARGRTARNAAMWATGGTAYVYQIHGRHFCLNVVTGPPGTPQAVLIRALEPRVGIEVMRARRGRDALRDLCSGPAKLCQALAIDLSLNFASLTGPALFIAPDPTGRAGAGSTTLSHPLLPSIPRAISSPIVTTTRIGLTVGRGHDLPLRFYLLGKPFVSQRDRAAEQELVDG
jgi:DNA-3-methyladenine glycosylase